MMKVIVFFLKFVKMNNFNYFYKENKFINEKICVFYLHKVPNTDCGKFLVSNPA
jgi:hypothetical protein